MFFIQGPEEVSYSGEDVEGKEDKLDCKSDYYMVYVMSRPDVSLT